MLCCPGWQIDLLWQHQQMPSVIFKHLMSVVMAAAVLAAVSLCGSYAPTSPFQHGQLFTPQQA